MQKTILCVEDNPDNLELITVLLERMDYNVVVAKDGQAAIDVATETLPDLILMDLHLPVMDGVTATKTIKSNEALAHIPIIAITADIYARQQFIEAGGDLYMQKPIRRRALQRIVEEAFSLG